MRGLTALLLAGGGLVALGGIAYAAEKQDGKPPLPVPPDQCTSSEEVSRSTSDLLSDNTVTADAYRKAANTLRTWEAQGNHFCNQEAKQAAQASIVLLEAKASSLDSGNPMTPWTLPPDPVFGHGTSATGLHGEAGTVFTLPNGDQWFFPSDPTLVPYFIPGGSTDINPALMYGQYQFTTTGCECNDCQAGKDCGCGRY